MAELAENAPVPGSVTKSKRKRRILVFCAVSLVNIGLLAFLLTQLLTPAPHPASDPLIGHPAPGFSLTVLSSNTQTGVLSLSNYKGRPVILNFWASWCDPCQEEAPLLENTWKQMRAQGKDLVILGIDFQEASKDGINFLQRFDITYPAIMDVDGSVASKYHVAGLPVTVFISRDGTVISSVRQQLTAQALASNLKLLM
ncbi:MAG TPA: TlpA disulfide reductase family protein [Ktedonobacteraceae bacterium]|nr:TlpA disulfide reductase family protein [Ktedonobacteraceae bacterium]